MVGQGPFDLALATRVGGAEEVEDVGILEDLGGEVGVGRRQGGGEIADRLRAGAAGSRDASRAEADGLSAGGMRRPLPPWRDDDLKVETLQGDLENCDLHGASQRPCLSWRAAADPGYRLQKASGIPLRTIQRFIGAENSPTVATLETIAKAVGLEIRVDRS